MGCLWLKALKTFFPQLTNLAKNLNLAKSTFNIRWVLSKLFMNKFKHSESEINQIYATLQIL